MYYVFVKIVYMKIIKFCVFFTLMTVSYSITALDWKTLVIGILSLHQVPKTHSHTYSVTNKLSAPVGFEYCLDHGVVPTIFATNRVAFESKCDEKQENCSLNFKIAFFESLSRCFSTAIESGKTLQVYTLACPIVKMTAQKLHPELPVFRYPWCMQCYDRQSSPIESTTPELLQYRTFKISDDNNINGTLSRNFDKINKKQKSKIEDQKKDL